MTIQTESKNSNLNPKTQMHQGMIFWFESHWSAIIKPFHCQDGLLLVKSANLNQSSSFQTALKRESTNGADFTGINRLCWETLLDKMLMWRGLQLASTGSDPPHRHYKEILLLPSITSHNVFVLRGRCTFSYRHLFLMFMYIFTALFVYCRGAAPVLLGTHYIGETQLALHEGHFQVWTGCF